MRVLSTLLIFFIGLPYASSFIFYPNLWSVVHTDVCLQMYLFYLSSTVDLMHKVMTWFLHAQRNLVWNHTIVLDFSFLSLWGYFDILLYECKLILSFPYIKATLLYLLVTGLASMKFDLNIIVYAINFAFYYWILPFIQMFLHYHFTSTDNP